MSAAQSPGDDLEGKTVGVALYSFDIGGSEMLAVTLIRDYLDRGAQVVCVSTRRGRGPLQKRLEGWGVECLPLGLEHHSRIVRPFLRWRLASWLRQRNVDALHVHHFSVFADVQRAASAAGVMRTIVTEHTADAVLHGKGYRRIVRRLANKASVCTAINAAVQEAIVLVSGLDRASVPIIENGVDTEHFVVGAKPPPHDPIVIGWVGRLHPHKDVMNGLRAFALAVAGSERHLKFLVAGDGEEMPMAQAFVRESGLGDMVEFLGAVPDVLPVLQRCHLLCVSSRTEGTPLAMLEAMSSGLPIVSTAVGGIPQSVTYAVARLAPPGDPEALAAELIAVARNDALRSRMGEAARELVLQRFSSKNMKRSYARLVLEGKINS